MNEAWIEKSALAWERANWINEAIKRCANPEAEQALLGAMLAKSAAFDKVSAYLRAEHFADPLHGLIFQAIADQIGQGRSPSAVSLLPILSGALEEANARQYLADLVANMVGITNVAEYGRVVHECWVRRQAIAAAARSITDISNPRSDEPPAEGIARVMSELHDLTEAAGSKRVVTLSESLELAMARAEEAARNGGILGLRTGFREIDEAVGGFPAGTYTVIGGRPGMGKSAFAGQVAAQIAEAGTGVIYFSLEMTAAALGGRLLSWRTQTAYAAFRRPNPSVALYETGIQAAKNLRDVPLFVDDRTRLSIADMTARVRAMQMRHKIGAVFIDHLNIVRSPKDSQRHGPAHAVETNSGMIREMAKSLNVAVFTLAQLSRGVEEREDKRPRLDDLRQSGAIEQDADVVMFLYRPEYYLAKERPIRRPGEAEEKYAQRVMDHNSATEAARGKMEVIVEKNREGERRTALLRFDPARSTVSPWINDANEGEEG